MENLMDPYEGQFTQEERKQLIAQTISALRKGKKYSQKGVAAALGVTQATYSTYERGRTEPPAEILVRLAYLFVTSVDTLVQKDRLARNPGDVEKQIADLRAQIQECETQLAENGGDNPMAREYEMTHLLNLQRGIQDCSRGGMYHNQKFRDEAEKHMISIAKHEKYGWTITSPTEELLNYIILKGWDDIDMGRGDLWAKFGIDGKGDSGKPKKPTAGLSGGETKKGGSRRYQCPKCKAIVRATKEVRIICGDCNVEFELT